MGTKIKAKEDMFNVGKCFTKGKEYEVGLRVSQPSGLMDVSTTNDLGEKHLIGSWWRNFEIVED